MDSCIIVGRHSFSREFLTTNTRKEAVDKLKHINKSVVEQAWYQVNPRRKKRNTDK